MCEKPKAFPSLCGNPRFPADFHGDGIFHRPRAAVDCSSILLCNALDALVKAEAFALHLHDLGVSQEAVENRCGRRDVAEELPPVLSRSIRGDQGGSRLMASHEDLQKVFRSAWTELLHAEVFENKKVNVGELIDEAATFAGGFSFSEVLSQVEDTPNDDSIPGPDGADCNGDRNVAFTDAGWTDEQDALVRRHEAGGGQFNELRARDLGVEREIKVREFLP
jgi:hypothetical protein